MLDLEQLRDIMRKDAEKDRNRKTVQVTGLDIEDALRQGAIELGLPLKRVEYEVINAGHKGMLGFGKKECVLLVYETRQKEVEAEETGSHAFDFSSEAVSMDLTEDKDGAVIVRLDSEGVLLKTTSPAGKGKKATEQMAVHKLEERGIRDYNGDMVAKVVKNADGSYVKVADFVYNPVNDALMSVDITDSEMKAIMLVRPPGLGGIDLSYDVMTTFLKNNGIVHGIKEDTLREFEDNPIYNQPIVVAEGSKPVPGEDAKINFLFEVDHSQVKLKEKNGRVDFKELNLVENVVEGQVLAKKINAQVGKPGRTVTGKMLPAKSGMDEPLMVGKNVKLSEDGMSAIAAANGQVLLSAEKITVETVNVIPGDVGVKTGNIIFLGTVIVKGSVDDGFNVKASGNIEVMGNVGKCDLDAEGEIIVHQGVNGKMGGSVKSGKGVWAKFIQNANVESGSLVVVSDGIINSHVVAQERIICQGKRASIVGGQLRASQEISAKSLGSLAGGETILEVGYDPKAKQKIAELNENITEVEKELEEVERNLFTLDNLKKKMKDKMPEDKQNYLDELSMKKADMETKIMGLSKEIEDIQTYLVSLKISGKISASGKVFPGVRIFIKDASLEVRNEYKAVTFVNEANLVKVARYEKPEEDYTHKR